MSAQITTGNAFLNGIDEKGTWLAKFFAKVCTYGLAYAVIYLAIQMALPQLRNGVVYGVAMTIVMAAPEMMIGGLTVEAMEKFKENKPLGSFLFVVATLFLSIGILTMVDIFVWHFKDGTQGQQMLSLYRAVVVLLYSAVHGIVAKLNEQREEKIQQVAQANDELALSNQEKIGEVSITVDTLASSVHILVDKVDTLCTEQAAIADHVHKNVDMTVDTVHNFVDIDQFHQLTETVHSIKISFTEVNQNILNITQNLYNMPVSTLGTQRPHPQNKAYTAHVEEVSDDRYALPETAETLDDESNTDSLKALAVPVLDVPGVSAAKVSEVIAAYLSGTGWRDMPGNYSRTIKPIKEAYEKYKASQDMAVYSTVDTL